MRIQLPWPLKGLSPNDRVHWRAKSRATRRYRGIAAWTVVEHRRHAMKGPYALRVVFCPKSRGPVPDKDNCIASFKAGQDGIADALRVNDRDLTVTHEMGERCKDGAVLVFITYGNQPAPVQGEGEA